jgi:hypothetical protein
VRLYIEKAQELIKATFFPVQNVPAQDSKFTARKTISGSNSPEAGCHVIVRLSFPVVHALLIFCLFNDAFQLHGLYFGESVG